MQMSSMHKDTINNLKGYFNTYLFSNLSFIFILVSSIAELNSTGNQTYDHNSIGNMILFSTPEANVSYTYGTRPHAVERTEEKS